MSEYILRIENGPRAQALLMYLRSLDFVDLVPRSTEGQATSGMQSLLADLPDEQSNNQAAVNQAINELRGTRTDAKP